MNLSETYKRRILELAGIKPLNETINFTLQDLSNAYDKSWKRIKGYDINMLRQAIKEGRAIGISYQSKGMPVTKFRIILPITLGTYNTSNGVPLKLSAFHLAGQSEKAARQSGKRSQEVKNEWRLFDLDPKSFKGMWFADKFFYEYPPGYKKGDKRFKSIDTEYDVGLATLNRIEREEKNIEEPEPIDLRNVEVSGPTPAETPENQETANTKEPNNNITSSNAEENEEEK